MSNMIPKNPSLRFSLLWGRRRNFSSKGNIIYVYQGRYAFYQALLLLGVREEDEVLLPSFHCPSMVVPVVKYGCKVGFYKTRIDLQIRVEDIEAVVKQKTRVVFLVHYFGLFQKEIYELKKYLSEKNILLAEDCAHIIPRRYEEAGNVGDISVFSPRKYLPLVDGALIKINNEIVKKCSSPKRLSLYMEIKSLKNAYEQSVLGSNWNKMKRFYFYVDSRINDIRNAKKSEEKGYGSEGGALFNPELAYRECSGLSRRIMNRVNLDEVFQKRQRNYSYLSAALYAKHIVARPPFLNGLNSGCIFGFPVMAAQRERVVKAIKDRRIETFTFGESLYGVENLGENSDELRLSRELLFVPMHQDLSERQIGYLIECLKELSGSLTQ